MKNWKKEEGKKAAQKRARGELSVVSSHYVILDTCNKWLLFNVLAGDGMRLDGTQLLFKEQQDFNLHSYGKLHNHPSLPEKLMLSPK